MRKCLIAKRHGQRLTDLDYDTILSETLNMLEVAIADGTFCKKSVERFQKSSIDVLLRLSQTESYYERFKGIFEPQRRKGDALV